MDIDDLVATFNGQHIGQEAIDLAALHTQLAQSLLQFNHSQSGFPSPIQTQSGFNFPQSSQSAVGFHASGPNTTPTSTPGNAYWHGRSRSTSRARSGSVSSRYGEPSSSAWSEDMQDMAEVEEEMMAEDEEGEELAWFHLQQQQRQSHLQQQQSSFAPSYRQETPIPSRGPVPYGAANYAANPVSPIFSSQPSHHSYAPRLPYTPTSPTITANDRAYYPPSNPGFLQYASVDPGQVRRGRWETTAT